MAHIFATVFFVRKLGQHMGVRKSLFLRTGQGSTWNVEPTDAIRNVVQQTVSENVFRFLARCHFRNSDRHMICKFLDLLIMGVCRVSNTFENNAFARPRARLDQVHVGLRTRRLFRRQLQRTVRFGLYLQRKHKPLQPFCLEKPNRGAEAPPTVTYRDTTRNAVLSTRHRREGRNGSGTSCENRVPAQTAPKSRQSFESYVCM